MGAGAEIRFMVGRDDQIGCELPNRLQKNIERLSIRLIFDADQLHRSTRRGDCRGRLARAPSLRLANFRDLSLGKLTVLMLIAAFFTSI
jgi:hypothetical protein